MMIGGMKLKLDKNLPVALFNGTVATTNGLYSISDIEIATAREFVKKYGFISAIGHEATAEIMSDLLDEDVPMNRIEFKQEVNQIAIAIKLNKRPNEGIILNKDEVNGIGYSLKLMERLK